jgi:hypothetical protein
MSGRKNKILFGVVLGIHALWMLFISYLWLNTPFSYESEAQIMSVTNIFKNVILGIQDKPSKDSLLFVNVSYDKMLVPRYDNDGFESGKIAITDRVALIKFLETISSKPEYRFVILDVFFEDSTSCDSTLQALVSRNPGLILPYHFDGGDTPMSSKINGWKGLADYTTDFGTFLKYSYLQKDTCRTVPLMLYEKYDQGNFHKHGWFYTSSGHLALNSLVLDLPLRAYDVFTDDTSGYSSVHLCELVNLPPSFIQQMVKNKIVVIGDFLDRDIHPSLYGNTPGPLIQLDAYLALKYGDHILPWTLLFLLFISYYIISWFLFSENSLIQNKRLDRWKASKIGGVFFDLFKYAFFLVLINIGSYLFFDVHLNVLILSLYIILIEYVVVWIRARNKKKIQL